LGELVEQMEGVVNSAKAILLPGAIAALILYFSYHAIAGDQGLAAWGGLQQEEETLLAEIETLKAERAALEIRSNASAIAPSISIMSRKSPAPGSPTSARTRSSSPFADFFANSVWNSASEPAIS
jgi:hypothetical protein